MTAQTDERLLRLDRRLAALRTARPDLADALDLQEALIRASLTSARPPQAQPFPVPHEAVANLHALCKEFPIYSPLGFLDSVDVSTGAASSCILAVDQGMIMAAIANALADDAMQHAFSDGPVEQAIRPLVSQEEFFDGTAGRPLVVHSTRNEFPDRGTSTK